jgi:hypothetical protein
MITLIATGFEAAYKPGQGKGAAAKDEDLKKLAQQDDAEAALDIPTFLRSPQSKRQQDAPKPMPEPKKSPFKLRR